MKVIFCPTRDARGFIGLQGREKLNGCFGILCNRTANQEKVSAVFVRCWLRAVGVKIQEMGFPLGIAVDRPFPTLTMTELGRFSLWVLHVALFR